MAKYRTRARCGTMPISRPGLTLDVLGRSDESIAFLKGIVAQNAKGHRCADHTPAISSASRSIYGDAITSYTQALASLPAGDKSAWSLLYFRGNLVRAGQSSGRPPRPTSSRRWCSTRTSLSC